MIYNIYSIYMIYTWYSMTWYLRYELIFHYNLTWSISCYILWFYESIVFYHYIYIIYMIHDMFDTWNTYILLDMISYILLDMFADPNFPQPTPPGVARPHGGHGMVGLRLLRALGRSRGGASEGFYFFPLDLGVSENGGYITVSIGSL